MAKLDESDEWVHFPAGTNFIIVAKYTIRRTCVNIFQKEDKRVGGL